jgi:hypothetical protein
MIRYWLPSRILTLLASLSVVAAIIPFSHGTLLLHIGVFEASAIVMLTLLIFILLEVLISWGTRIGEGYWPGWAAPLQRRLILVKEQRYKRIINYLSETDQVRRDPTYQERATQWARLAPRRVNLLQDLLRHYPSKEMLAPTKLGNTLRASQERISQRYGMDLLVVYPRLLALLGSKKRRRVETAQAALGMWERLSAGFLVLAVVTPLLLTSPRVQAAVVPVWVLAVSLPLLALACWGCYIESIRAAVKFGSEVEVIFDLHRIDLLRAMHLPTPNDLEDQRRIFSVLSGMLQGNSLHNIEFVYESGGKLAEERTSRNNSNRQSIHHRAGYGCRARSVRPYTQGMVSLGSGCRIARKQTA